MAELRRSGVGVRRLATHRRVPGTRIRPSAPLAVQRNRRRWAAGLACALALIVASAPQAAGQKVVTLEPASGPPGSTFRATATRTCSQLTVTWDNPPQTFEAENATSLTAVVPKDSKLGSHTVATSCSGMTGGSQGATGCFGNCPSTTPAPPVAVGFQVLGSEVFVVTEPAPSTTVARTTTVAPTIPPTTTGPVTALPLATAPPTSVPLTTLVVPTSAVGPPRNLAPQTEPAVAPQTELVVESKDLLVVLLLAGVALLALAIAGLLRRLLAHRHRAAEGPSRDWPQPVPPRARTFTQLADDLLGGSRARSPALAGPSAARIAELCGSDVVAAPLMATMFWEACVADRRFADVLRRAGASERALPEGQVLVVRHGGDTRHDLLVLDPGFVHRQPRATRLTFFDVSAGPSPSWRARSIQGSSGPRPSLDEAMVDRALTEVGAASEFGVIVAAPPRVLLTHCPSPAWGVSTAVDSAVATAGAVVVTKDGTVAVTTALHAIKGATVVTVGGKPGRIHSAHESTDSCLIAMDAPRVDGVHRGRAGALRGMSPRQYDHAAFDGAASGAKATTVTAWDLSILAVQNYVGSKVYTSPDTVPGDSGAALIDSADQIIGFAVYRSAFGEPIEYSAWVWADQVFGAHAVEPLGSKTVAP